MYLGIAVKAKQKECSTYVGVYTNAVLKQTTMMRKTITTTTNQK